MMECDNIVEHTSKFHFVMNQLVGIEAQIDDDDDDAKALSLNSIPWLLAIVILCC